MPARAIEQDEMALIVGTRSQSAAPVSWRLALNHPERITAIISQNGNAYAALTGGCTTSPARRPGNDEIQLELFADHPANVELYPTVHAYFRESQVPLLAARDRNDELSRPDGARAFVGDLPDAEIHLLDGGHFLLESHVDEVATLIRDLMARVRSQEGGAPVAAPGLLR